MSGTVVEWGLAGQIARRVAGEGTGKHSVTSADLVEAAQGTVEMVSAYTGLEPIGALPEPEAIDRPEWIEANLVSLQGLTAKLESEMGGSVPGPVLVGGTLRTVAGGAIGTEVGLLSGYLARRVLGQYDVSLFGPHRQPRLLFVAPNLAEARAKLDVPQDPFLRWIALHESTHVVQFSAVEWLRPHLGGIAEELLGSAFVGIDTTRIFDGIRGLRIPDPRNLIGVIRKGDWLPSLIGGPQRGLLDQLQSTMAVVEGYSEHVMDGIGAEIDPGYLEMRDRVEAVRDNQGTLASIISRLLGMEMKMRQYRQGKAFCDEVVERRGLEALNVVWSEPAAMPDSTELEQPGLWLSRVG